MSGKKAPSVIWHLSQLSGAFMREESDTLNLDERQMEMQLLGYTYLILKPFDWQYFVRSTASASVWKA